MAGTLKVISWNMTHLGRFNPFDGDLGPITLEVFKYADIVAIMELDVKSGTVTDLAEQSLQYLAASLNSNDPNAQWDYKKSGTNAAFTKVKDGNGEWKNIYSTNEDAYAILYKQYPDQSSYKSTNNSTVSQIIIKGEIDIVDKDIRDKTINFADWRKPGFCSISIPRAGTTPLDIGLMILHANAPDKNPKASLWLAAQTKQCQQTDNLIFVSDTNVDMCKELPVLDTRTLKIDEDAKKEYSNAFFQKIEKIADVKVLLGDLKKKGNGVKTTLAGAGKDQSIQSIDGTRASAFDNFLFRSKNKILKVSVAPSDAPKLELEGADGVHDIVLAALKTYKAQKGNFKNAIKKVNPAIKSGMMAKKLLNKKNPLIEKSPAISDHFPIFYFFTFD